MFLCNFCCECSGTNTACGVATKTKAAFTINLQVRSGVHFPKFLVSRPQTPGGDVAGIVEDADESSKVGVLHYSEQCVAGRLVPLGPPRMKCQQYQYHHSVREHMLQFLKGQKVFALTDGRLFWRKEGKQSSAGVRLFTSITCCMRMLAG